MSALMRELDLSGYNDQRIRDIVSGRPRDVASRERMHADEKHQPFVATALPPAPPPAGFGGFVFAPSSETKAAAAEMYLPNVATPVAPPPDAADSAPAAAQFSDPTDSNARGPRMVDTYKKRVCAISGLQVHDFGAAHVSGWLVQPNCGDAAVPNMPAKSGTGLKLRPAKLDASCCVPPPYPEPTILPNPSSREAAQQHDAMRVMFADKVMNRVVFDSLEPPSMHQTPEPADSAPPESGYEGGAAPCRPVTYHDALPCWYAPASSADTTLVFESRFESGNLRRALQVYPNEYDLVLRPDINTRGHTQWFYFAVMNTQKGARAKFNLINLAKDDSLYREGMLPLVHSAKEAASTGIGWHRAGEDIAYYANSIKRGRNRTYSTLTFTLEFKHSNDTIHVAHCYPYTYTDLQRYLCDIEADPDRKHRMTRSVLCSTLAGNTCDLLTITTPTEKAELMARKRGIVISGRVHPGESNASWMMKGVLDFLTGPSLDAKFLRDNFVFKVVPMLNPDGVINGNYRCSLAGVDLNRVWAEPSGKLHPTVYSCRKMIKAFIEEREVAMYCDLHGHSRKKDIFLYSCEKRGRDLQPMYVGYPVPGSMGGRSQVPTRFQERLLPLLIHHNIADVFNYRFCNFKVQRSKGGTSRVVNFREMGLVNSFTLEASFCGASGGPWGDQHFSTWHLEQMGAALCTAIIDYWDPEDYGMGEVMKSLDFMHPVNGDPAPRFVMTSDGRLVEVEDDEAPTDSDDESSDDDEKQAARLARRQARVAAAQEASGDNGSGGCMPAEGDGNGITRFLAGFRLQGGGDLDDLGGVERSCYSQGVVGSSEGYYVDANGDVVMCPGGGDAAVDSDPGAAGKSAKSKRKSKLKYHKELLKAEQQKADEGLAACLFSVHKEDTASTVGSLGSEHSAGGGYSASSSSYYSPQAPPSPVPGSVCGDGHLGGLPTQGSPGHSSGRRNKAQASSNTATPKLTPAGLEYARQKGIYRGETLSWANAGTSALPAPASLLTSAASPTTPKSPVGAAHKLSPEAHFFGQIGVPASPTRQQQQQQQAPGGSSGSGYASLLPQYQQQLQQLEDSDDLRATSLRCGSPAVPTTTLSKSSSLSAQANREHNMRQLQQTQGQQQQIPGSYCGVHVGLDAGAMTYSSGGTAAAAAVQQQQRYNSSDSNSQLSPRMSAAERLSPGEHVSPASQLVMNASYQERMYPSPQRRLPRVPTGSGGGASPMGGYTGGRAGSRSYASLASVADSLAACYGSGTSPSARDDGGAEEMDFARTRTASPVPIKPDQFEALINSDPLFHR